MISRAERSLFSDWAWTVDRWLLASLALLIVAGLVFAMAGSPPVAERLHLPTFHFVNRQVLYLLPALVLMIATSFLSPRHVRRLALVIFIVSLALVFATIFYGQEVKGAKRWIFGVQPSEFLKPAFVVLVAWAFSEGGASQGRSRQSDRASAPAGRDRAADAAAGLRPDDADFDCLGGAVFHGWLALDLGCRIGRAWRRLGAARL